MKLSVRSGCAQSDMQPPAVVVPDILLLLLASLKLGSLKRIVVAGRFSGRFSDSLGTAAEGRRGFCLIAAGGGRGCGWEERRLAVSFEVKNEDGLDWIGLGGC